MKYVRMFLLHFEQAFEYRSRNLVWFLVELLNPLLYLLFWRAAYAGGKLTGMPLSFSEITSYYFLLIFAGAFLTVHVEEDVARHDIQEGGLVKYLLRPFSYFWIKFYEELPWRVIQGAFGVVILAGFLVSFGSFLHVASAPAALVVAGISGVIAYFLSFVFKMIVGLSALWMTDYSGFEQLVTVIFMVFAGFVIPVQFFHPLLRTLAEILPFAYMIYYPVMALEGNLLGWDAVRVIAIQIVWLITLLLCYKKLWVTGLRLFTGIGQ
ncbi:hypothetical protein M1555_01290 [Patescibacteria group bacterium]|nr:hypothetical protein [Patescibacteria group bacterium]